MLTVFTVFGCAKEYRFVVDAPAKYPSSMTFKTMRIDDFSTPQRRYGQYLKEIVASWVANEGYIKVVHDRPEAIVTGSLDVGNIAKNSYNTSYDCSYKDSNGNKATKTCSIFYMNKKLTVTGNFQMFSAENRQMVIGDSKSYNFDKTWFAFSADEARSKPLSDEEIVSSLLKQIAKDIVYSITPHKYEVKNELKGGNDPNIKLGIVYLTEGRAEQAISIWDRVISYTQRDNDKAASYYNIGVIKESRGEYKDAFEAYSKANVLMPRERLYIHAMTKSESFYKQQLKLLEQKGM
jgi:tetratricopeptide (TPR) repeat protein